MKKKICVLTLCMASVLGVAAQSHYTPTAENIEARKEFEGFRFGIFLHWGIYSTYAQGEWYLNSGKLNKDEYAKAASCFYPVNYQADEWVRAIKQSGAKYITFTTRHHDGFSMFHTAANKYNIVEATPFKRDVLKELANACQQQDVQLHLYYSILDWIRPDYPLGRTGLNTGRESRPDYDSYFAFMKQQLHELLTHYGNIGALWFDGYWDHDSDSIPFDWHMPELYSYIHSIKPDCLIGNNHHITPIDGEDFQMFERDLPGENKAGLSGQDISALPLEMCQTMNGMWGYKVADQNYKTTEELVELLVRAAAKGSNLLLNIGPQPNGELPALALDRLKGIGAWMKIYGETVYGTKAGVIAEQPWGVSTTKGKKTYLHIFDKENAIKVPLDMKPRKVVDFKSRKAVPFLYNKKGKTMTIALKEKPQVADYVIEVEL
ncbi:MAG: alpha-L-fucosidase [Prevotellaceae bacterium]|nr:alpha-L-fucosidase [Prevotella sp.]MDD7258048.1 alpha-L-fucosidase [Prevotellaceae bacterium]MDY6130089.1 alpha-L-fucosidase [Prevotella sp.]